MFSYHIFPSLPWENFPEIYQLEELRARRWLIDAAVRGGELLLLLLDVGLQGRWSNIYTVTCQELQNLVKCLGWKPPATMQPYEACVHVNCICVISVEWHSCLCISVHIFIWQCWTLFWLSVWPWKLQSCYPKKACSKCALFFHISCEVWVALRIKTDAPLAEGCRHAGRSHIWSTRGKEAYCPYFKPPGFNRQS